MMEKPKLKVCGMRDAKNMVDVAMTRPDFMGFIFYEHSKRFVGHEFTIPQGFPQAIKRVGVFVNESVDRVLQLAQQHQLDFAQLHGDEPIHICETLKKKINVIKVFRVDEHFDFNKTREFEGLTDFFMFDTKTVDYGGSGKSFDWSLLEKYNFSTPFFLSGGLSVDNIKQALDLQHTNLFGIDVNSGIEESPGMKDLHKLYSLVNILNSFSHEIHR